MLCEGNNGVGQSVAPLVEVEAALRLEINVEEEFELPLVWMLATVFLAIWKLRVDKSRVQLYDPVPSLSKYT